MEKKDKYADLEHRIGVIHDLEDGIFGDAGPISIVFEGAIEQDFKMYSPNKFVYAQMDEEKRMITGPAMRADYKILQQDFWTGQYYTISYSKEQINQFMKLFSKNGYNRVSNLQHSEVAGNGEWAYSIEAWQVIDPKMDKAAAMGFQDINVGDMYVTYYVENKDMWDFIKKNGFGGFSIEAFIVEKLSAQSKEHSKTKIENEIKEILFSDKFTDTYKLELVKSKLGIA